MPDIYFHHLWKYTHTYSWAHPPTQQRQYTKKDTRIYAHITAAATAAAAAVSFQYNYWIICFHFEMIEIFGVCCLVFPRRTLSEPRGCFTAATDHFYTPTNWCEDWSRARSRLLGRPYTRTHNDKHTSKLHGTRCDRIFICQFSCCVYIVFKFSYHNFLFRFAHLYKYIYIHFRLFVDCLLTDKMNGTSELTVCNSNWSANKKKLPNTYWNESLTWTVTNNLAEL